MELPFLVNLTLIMQMQINSEPDLANKIVVGGRLINDRHNRLLAGPTPVLIDIVDANFITTLQQKKW